MTGAATTPDDPSGRGILEVRGRKAGGPGPVEDDRVLSVVRSFP